MPPAAGLGEGSPGARAGGSPSHRGGHEGGGALPLNLLASPAFQLLLGLDADSDASRHGERRTE